MRDARGPLGGDRVGRRPARGGAGRAKALGASVALIDRSSAVLAVAASSSAEEGKLLSEARTWPRRSSGWPTPWWASFATGRAASRPRRADPDGLDAAGARGRALARPGVGQRRGGRRPGAGRDRARGHRPRRHRRPGRRAGRRGRGGGGRGDRPRRAARPRSRATGGRGCSRSPCGRFARRGGGTLGALAEGEPAEVAAIVPAADDDHWRAPHRGSSASSPPRCRASP